MSADLRCARCFADLDSARHLKYVDGTAFCYDLDGCLQRYDQAPMVAYVDSARRVHLVRIIDAVFAPVRLRVRIVESVDPRAVGREVEVEFTDLQARDIYDRLPRPDYGTVALQQATAIVRAAQQNGEAEWR